MMIIEANSDLNQQNFDIQSNAETVFAHIRSKNFQTFQLITTIGTTSSTHSNDFIQLLRYIIMIDFFIFAECNDFLHLDEKKRLVKSVDETRSDRIYISAW